MIDPTEIFKTAMASHQLGQQQSQSLSQPFMAGIQGMNVASGSNASGVVAGMQSACADMIKGMNNVHQSVMQQMFAHQQEQQASRPEDFANNMNDLRPTESQGFSEENPQNFYAPFNAMR